MQMSTKYDVQKYKKMSVFFSKATDSFFDKYAVNLLLYITKTSIFPTTINIDVVINWTLHTCLPVKHKSHGELIQ